MNIWSEGILPREQLTTLTAALTPEYDKHVREYLEQSLVSSSDYSSLTAQPQMHQRSAKIFRLRQHIYTKASDA